MIDNPLEQQTLDSYDGLYKNEKFEEHCTDAAKEIFHQGGGDYLPPIGESEEIDGSHQIEEVEFIKEVEE